jgi:YesN/AraC family two-component response regulator
VEKAKRALETTPDPFSEITYGVGYEDVLNFRGLFVQITGVSPTDYRRKYGFSQLGE